MDIGPFSMTFLRFFLGMLFMMPFFLKDRSNIKKLKTSPLSDILKIMGLGILSVFFSMGALQIAVHNGNASIPAIMISSNPVFIYLIIGVRTRQFNRTMILKLVSGLIGIAVIITFSLNSDFKNPLIALSFSFVSSLLFAIYTVLARDFVLKYGNLFVTFLSFLAGSIMYIPFIFLFNEHIAVNITFKGIIIMLYMGIIVTGAGYLSYFRGLKAIPVERGSMVFFLKPVFAVILSIIFLHESMNIYQLIAIVPVLYAISPEIRKINAHNNR